MVTFRDIDADDYPFLREMLYEALFVPEGEAPFPASILDNPDLSKYIVNWGRHGDFGRIAQVDGKDVGAAWCRTFTASNKSYGFVDETTPELTIAILEAHQGQGLGTSLIREVLQLAQVRGHTQVSLSVDKRSRAARLYQRLGFQKVEELDTAYTMLIGLEKTLRS